MVSTRATLAWQQCLEHSRKHLALLAQGAARRGSAMLAFQAACTADPMRSWRLRAAAAELHAQYAKVGDRCAQLMQQARQSTGGTVGSAWRLTREDELARQLEPMRLVDAAAGACASERADFESLLCGAQGLYIVDARLNPLRPEHIARTFHTALRQCTADHLLADYCLPVIGEALGLELAGLYSVLAAHLRAAGTQGADHASARAVAARTAA